MTFDRKSSHQVDFDVGVSVFSHRVFLGLHFSVDCRNHGIVGEIEGVCTILSSIVTPRAVLPSCVNNFLIGLVTGSVDLF
jgi:hypothetical protein